jgi:hypothetical protein
MATQTSNSDQIPHGTTATTTSPASGHEHNPAQNKSPTVLQRPLLLPGEPIDEYNELSDAVFNYYKPKDIIEEIRLQEYVEMTWQVIRERRLINGVIGVQALHTLTQVLLQHYKPENVYESARGWSRREDAALRDIEKLLKQIGLSTPMIIALATAEAGVPLDRLEEMTMRKSTKRDKILDEIELRRALKTKRSAEEPLDAEFQVVETAPSAHQEQLTGQPQKDKPPVSATTADHDVAEGSA